MFVLQKEEKLENPVKKTLEQGENLQQTQRTCGTGLESNPGHIGGRQAFSPLCDPCSPIGLFKTSF